jgi:hypothetical protein
MPRVQDPFRFVLIAVAGWMNQRQLQIIDYLREENRFFVSNSTNAVTPPLYRQFGDGAHFVRQQSLNRSAAWRRMC